MSEKKAVVCPFELPGNCSEYANGFGNQVLFCVGGGGEDDVACEGKKESCHGGMAE